MSRVPKDEEATLAAEFERDAENDELWEEVPSPTPSSPRRTLGTQVTIRLEGKSAQQLRDIARQRGVGYTSLLRKWIEERLNLEAARVRVSRPQITRASPNMTLELLVQLSGAGRMVRVYTGAA
jgi:hypothetical protein